MHHCTKLNQFLSNCALIHNIKIHGTVAIRNPERHMRKASHCGRKQQYWVHMPQSLHYCLFAPHICMVLFFTHIPFVVNHTFNATTPNVSQLLTKTKTFKLNQSLTWADFGIYVVTCVICHEQYVGQTSNKFSKRWSGHCSNCHEQYVGQICHEQYVGDMSWTVCWSN